MEAALETLEAQIAPPQPTALLMPDTRALKARIASIESIITDLFVEGTHYGEPFPGSDKKSLLQPGAEIVCAAFAMTPEPAVKEIDEGDGHRTFLCEGHLLSNGISVGSISATCTTLEVKYRYRKGGRVCPECGFEGAIIKGKEEYGGGWLCFKKKDGCGTKFKDGDKSIEDQVTSRIENGDPADLYHTARMMAEKRWLVALTRRTFALSARFVDAEGYRSQAFNWKGKGGDLLRALPGEKKEKWARVGRFTLQEFGKEPREITNVEGAVVMEWLRSMAGGAVAADTDVPDMSPVSPPRGKGKKSEGGIRPKPAEEEKTSGQQALAGPEEPPGPASGIFAKLDDPKSSVTAKDLDRALEATGLVFPDVQDAMDPRLDLSTKNTAGVIAKGRGRDFLAVIKSGGRPKEKAA